MKRKILAAGTLAFDTLETPHGKKEKIIGGSVNHFAITASLFTELEISAIIGADFPKEHLTFLNKRGIGTGNVEISKGETFHWHARYQGAMNEAETLASHLNVLVDYNPVMNAAAKKCEILFLANFDPVKQLQTIKEAEGAKIVICDTMNFWIDRNVEELKKVLKQVDIFVLSEHEARNLAKENNIIVALHKIVAMGPKTVVIKRGEYGSLIYRDGEKIFCAPAYPIKKVVDPTGAGDTFAGGFVGYLATSPDYNKFSELKKAMLYGSAASSFIVEGFGCDGTINIGMKDIQGRYEELVSMMRID